MLKIKEVLHWQLQKRDHFYVVKSDLKCRVIPFDNFTGKNKKNLLPALHLQQVNHAFDKELCSSYFLLFWCFVIPGYGGFLFFSALRSRRRIVLIRRIADKII